MPQRPDDRSETRAAFPVPAAGPQTFQAEQLVADRFRIVRFVAGGGMGQVYEAEDLELHQNLALKTIRPEIAQDERAIARFKREAFLARQVTHPNICRIFDLFVHRPPVVNGVAAPPITFVTMQLLNGQTLAERLRSGRMLAEEALPLIAQMADALDAAHQVGVVHRDFKCNNVMLLPQSGGPRAVVTDFGMAWRAGEDPDKRGTSPTLPGEILGTPDYMAPEQLEGGKVTPATDVYALGLVMYEMATSDPPVLGVIADGRGGQAPDRGAAPAARARPGYRCPLGRGDHALPRAASRGSLPARRRRRGGAARGAPRRARVADPRRRAAPGRGGDRPGRRVRLARPRACRRTGSRGRLRFHCRRRPERAPALHRRPRLPERLRAAGSRLALDRVRRDADDRTGRRRAAADDSRARTSPA